MKHVHANSEKSQIGWRFMRNEIIVCEDQGGQSMESQNGCRSNMTKHIENFVSCTAHTLSHLPTLLCHLRCVCDRVVQRCRRINWSPEAKRKRQEEAAEFRKIGVWDESKLYEVDTLISESQQNQQKIHIAEIMGICHIKGAEVPESQQQNES